MNSPTRARFFLAVSFWALLIGTINADFPGAPKKGDIGRRTVNAPLPNFTLTDQDGKPFRFESLRGKIVVVTFIFTACPDFCPLVTANFTRIQQKLAAERRAEFFLLSITTDPETDAPAVLKSYGERYQADPRTWAFLAGDRKSLAAVWKAFGVNVKRLSNGEIQHTELTALVDRNGIERVKYLGARWQARDLLKDFEALRVKGNAALDLMSPDAIEPSVRIRSNRQSRLDL